MDGFLHATVRLTLLGLALLSLLCLSVYWAFSGNSPDWPQGASAPGKRVQSVAAAVNGRLFVFAGFRNKQLEPSNQTFIYDVAADNWTEGAPADELSRAEQSEVIEARYRSRRIGSA